jgi:hypothetical protein
MTLRCYSRATFRDGDALVADPPILATRFDIILILDGTATAAVDTMNQVRPPSPPAPSPQPTTALRLKQCLPSLLP